MSGEEYHTLLVGKALGSPCRAASQPKIARANKPAHTARMTRACPTPSDAFVQQVTPLPARTSGTRGRLLFAMDATASREPTWDHACGIQGEMFVTADALGGLDVRLAFYRGFDEFKVSRWPSDGRELARLMSAVR